MYSYSEIIIFIETNASSFLTFLEIYNCLKKFYTNIKVYPVIEKTEIQKFFVKYHKKSNLVLYLLIASFKTLKLNEENSKFFFSHTYSSYMFKYILNKVDLNHLISLDSPNNHVRTIDASTYFENKNSGFYRSIKNLNFCYDSVVDYENKVWIKSIIIWYLYLSNNFSINDCSFGLKKIHRIFEKISKMNKNQNENCKNKKIIFSKELPFHFLYHSSLIDSVLNTPSTIINFQTWKNNGFIRILHFLGKIFVFKEDTRKLWIKFDEDKKNKILKHFEIETKKLKSTLNLIYVFKKKFENLKNLIEMSSLDIALILRSVFDLKIKNSKGHKLKKNFWLGIKSLLEFKNLKIFIKKEKKVHKFISRICRIVLSKKTFISQKNVRILYLIGSNHITYKMIEGFLEFLILIFNRNKIKQKLFSVIIKERNDSFLFVSHQNKKNFLFYHNYLLSQGFLTINRLIKIEKNLIVVKFSKIYEKDIISELIRISKKE